MLLDASVGEVKRGRAPLGRVVVVMRHYPRFLPRKLVPEYHRVLAPEDRLFRDFRESLEASGDHDAAFAAVDYERRFRLSEQGYAELVRLAERSQQQDVVLVCQCEKFERCHRHLLMLIARNLLGTPIDRIRFDYPIFEARTRNLADVVSAEIDEASGGP